MASGGPSGTFFHTAVDASGAEEERKERDAEERARGSCRREASDIVFDSSAKTRGTLRQRGAETAVSSAGDKRKRERGRAERGRVK